MFVLKIADGLPDAGPIVMGHRRWTPRGAVTIPESEHFDAFGQFGVTIL